MAMTTESHDNISRVGLIGIAILIALLVPSLNEWTGLGRIAIVVVVTIIAFGAGASILLKATPEQNSARKTDRVLALLCVLGLGTIVFTINLEKYIEGVVANARTPILAPVASATNVQPAQPPQTPEQNLKQEFFQKARKNLQQGNFNEAEAGFREALARASEQNMFASKLTAALGLAETLVYAKKTREAFQTISQTKDWAQTTTDDPPADLIRLLALEGAAHTMTGNPTTALPVLEQGLELATKHHERDLVLRGVVLKPLVDALLATGNLDGATKVVQEHVDRLIPVQGLPLNEMVKWLDTAGRTYGIAKQFDKSAKMFQSSLSYKKSSSSDNSVDVALTRGNLALSLWNAANKEEARLEIEKALMVIREKLPATHSGRISIEKMGADFGVSDPAVPQITTSPQDPTPR